MKKGLIFSILLSLFACTAPLVKSNITNFYAEGFLSSPKTFTPLHSGPQKDNPQYTKYLKLISAELEKHNLSQAADSSAADYGLLIDYGVNSGVLISQMEPDAGKTPSIQESSFSSSETEQVYRVAEDLGVAGLVYNRFLTVELIPLKNKSSVASEKFEGIVQSSGSVDTFDGVSRCLIKALFKNFPGKNGVSVAYRDRSGSCMDE